MDRDSYFDNLKGFLIISVVVGHFLNPLIKDSDFAKYIITVIYSYHMPAFVFVSAYFGKHNSFEKLFKTLLVPYAVFQVIYLILSHAMWGRGGSLQFLQPAFSLWFLLSLFCWRAIIDQLIKVRWILPLSFIFGILVAFDTSIGAFASLGRTIAFLPFFLLGYTFDKDKFMKFANRTWVKIASAVLILGILIFLYFESGNIPFNELILKHSYKKAGQPEWGFLYRICLYALSTLLIYLIAAITPRKHHWFTYLGKRTMSVYLLHGIVFKSIQYMTDTYEKINTRWEILLTGLFAVVLVFVLSLKPLDTLIRKLSSLPVEKLLVKKSPR